MLLVGVLMNRRKAIRVATVPFAILLLAVGAQAGADAQGRGFAAHHMKPAVRLDGIVVPFNADVTTTVQSKDASDRLAYGLKKPTRIVVCRDCQAGDTRDLGVFEEGQTLVFCLSDRTQGQSFSSNDPAHARVVHAARYKWIIEWDDAGGDGNYNDLVTVVKLSPI
jgi:hypothetical protein